MNSMMVRALVALRAIRRRPLRTTAWCAVICLTLAAIAWFALEDYATSRRRFLVVHSQERLSVEIYARESPPRLVESLTAPTTRPIPLRAGTYEMRVHGLGRVGYRQELELSDPKTSVSTSLDQRRYVSPVQASVLLAPVDLGPTSGLLSIEPRGLRLVGGVPDVKSFLLDSIRRPGLPDRWKLDLCDSPPVELGPGFSWSRPAELLEEFSEATPEFFLPYVVGRYVDLDRDGVGDVILAGRHQAWVLAVSGANGRTLWCAARGFDVLAARTPNKGHESRALADTFELASAICGMPDLAPDVDGDGVPEILATVVERRPAPDSDELLPSADARVELLSGASGATIWRRDVPREWLDVTNEPLARSRHFVSGWMFGQFVPASDDPFADAVPFHLVLSPARCILDGQSWQVGLTAGRKAALLDARSGDVKGAPVTIEGWPAIEPHWRDLDGDRQADLVVVMTSGDQPQRLANCQLAAWSLATSRQLWPTQDFGSDPQASGGLNRLFSNEPDHPEVYRPALVDLNGDGQGELVTWAPDASRPSDGLLLTVRDGGTGRVLWRSRRIRDTPQEEANTWLVGPDVNDDGWADLFIASNAEQLGMIRAQAISGRDGAELWRSQAPDRSRTQGHASRRVRRVAWRQAGLDGWPQFVVEHELSAPDSDDRQRGLLTCFSAGAGTVDEHGEAIDRALIVDLDGDGAEELLTCRAPVEWTQPVSWEVTRGLAREAYSRATTTGDSLIDLDQDGVPERMLRNGDLYEVRHGLTDVLLWSHAIDATAPPGAPSSSGSVNVWLSSMPPAMFVAPRAIPGEASANERGRATKFVTLEAADLDGDGIGELLVAALDGWRQSVVSGRTGRRLWQTRLAPHPQTFVADLDDSGGRALLFVETVSEGESSGAILWVHAGASGRLMWKAPLPPGPWHVFTTDCDGDSRPDLVLVGLESDVRGPRVALRGRDGKELWRHDEPAAESTAAGPLYLRDRIVVHAADGGRAVAIVAYEARRDPFDDRFALGGFDVATGEMLWERKFKESSRSSIELTPLRSAGRVTHAALSFPDADHLLVLNGEGEQTAPELPPAPTASDPYLTHPGEARLAAVDVDGDGNDELALFRRGELLALRFQEPARPLWRRPLDHRSHSFQAWIPGLASHVPWAVVVNQLTLQAEAISARDGQTVWTCPLPARSMRETRFDQRHESQTFRAMLQQTLPPSPGGGPPLLALSNGLEVSFDGGALRQAMRPIPRPHRRALGTLPNSPVHMTDAPTADVTTTGQATPAEPFDLRRALERDPRQIDDGWRGWGVERASLPAPPGRDANWSRSLPWTHPADPFSFGPDVNDDPSAVQPASRFLGPIFRRVLMSGSLIVAPLAYAYVVLRRRRFTLRQLLALPLLVGLFLTFATSAAVPGAERGDDGDVWFDRLLISDDWLERHAWIQERWQTRWMLAVRYSAPTAFAAMAVWFAARRRWRALAIGGGILLAGCVLTALTLWELEVRDFPLRPLEYYVWDGWYCAVWDGCFATAWCGAAITPFAWAVVWWRARRASA